MAGAQVKGWAAPRGAFDRLPPGTDVGPQPGGSSRSPLSEQWQIAVLVVGVALACLLLGGGMLMLVVRQVRRG